MENRAAADSIYVVRDADRIKRYTLVPRSPPGAKPDGVRRFTLARVGASPRSALGADRLERMEEIAEGERGQSRNGGDPQGGRPLDADVDQDSRS